jgi:hypothetical protein
MRKVVPFARTQISRDERMHRPGECQHRHIHLDSHGGIVTCINCKASLSPFWALSMLSGQYELAVAGITRLSEQLERAHARINDLSAALDTAVELGKSHSIKPRYEP